MITVVEVEQVLVWEEVPGCFKPGTGCSETVVVQGAAEPVVVLVGLGDFGSDRMKVTQEG